MRRRAFVGLGIGLAAAPLWKRVTGKTGTLLVASPAASPAALSGGSPVASPGAASGPVAVASRTYAANGRFAWERIGAAHLSLDLTRYANREGAVAAFPSVVEQRLYEIGAGSFALAEAPAFADESAAWVGFDREGRPTALLFFREERDVHVWLARQVAYAGRTPDPAHPLGALVAIARGVFALPRQAAETPLEALPGRGDVPAGLELFEEGQVLISPDAMGERGVDATPAS